MAESYYVRSDSLLEGLASHPPVKSDAPRLMPWRLLFLALLFASELIGVSIALDSSALVARTGLSGFVRDWGPWTLRCIVGSVAIFITFAYLKHKVLLDSLATQFVNVPIAYGWLVAHGCAILIFGRLSSSLYGGAAFGTEQDILAAGWMAAGIGAIATAGRAFIPWTVWMQLVRGTGFLPAYALAGGLSACVAGYMARLLWRPATELTFALVAMTLRPFLSDVVASPASWTVGTHLFWVKIAPECSGLEGAGLILVFSVVGLALFRKECRFPRALLLIPLGAAVAFMLNALRLAALIAIGNAGFRQIAAGGFHSQSGWILFNTVAVGLCLTVRHVPWFGLNAGRRDHPTESVATPAAPYLVPFLSILAAGMIAGAAAGRFEWLYPLRFLAAVAALWFFRRIYVGIDFRWSWVAPAISLLIAVLWVALDRFSNPKLGPAGPAALLAAPTMVRTIWLGFRVLATVITVPLAEELAFRGYLLRRLVSLEFESVPYRDGTWLALLVSSAAFGVLHGRHWVAATIAGAILGWAAMRRNRIGEAVVAHATANALLSAYALIYHDWSVW